MERPKRILNVLGSVNLGGAESRIMDLYRCLDHTEFQFDFVVHTEAEGYFQKEIQEMGGRVYAIPRFKICNYREYRKAWISFFEAHPEFQAVHGHMTSTAGIYLPIAKRSGVPVTIAHARSAGTDPGLKGIMTKLFRLGLSKKADILIACSTLAGNAVFGKRAMQMGQVRILPNAIQTEKYRFNLETRKKIRQELGVVGRLVIGHVGRFHYAKNHEFLLRVFMELEKKRGDIALLLLGEGERMEEIKALAKELGIEKKVVFAGNRGNIADYYQAMDYMVFPSRFEGMPGTVVEAQVSGLPCLMADTITPEVKFTSLIDVLPLETDPSEWADFLWNKISSYPERKDHQREAQEQGFDSQSQIQGLIALYTAHKSRIREEISRDFGPL